MDAIKIKKLIKEYKDFKLDICDVNIKRGYITGFIGPNGAGKTTTIKALLGLIKGRECDIEMFGKDISEFEELKNDMGYIGTPSGFLEESTLRNIKNTVSVFYKNWDEKFYKDMMKKLKFNDKKLYKDLSQGKKKQFEFVIALSHHPKILIMDEPTANLDPIVRNEIIELIQSIMEKEDMTVFYSTHITSDLDKCSDYIIFINDGKVILQGEKDKICEEHVIVKGSKEIIDEDIKKEFIFVNIGAYNFEGLMESGKKAYDLFGDEAVYDKCSIEDIMLYYTKKGEGINEAVI